MRFVDAELAEHAAFGGDGVYEFASIELDLGVVVTLPATMRGRIVVG